MVQRLSLLHPERAEAAEGVGLGLCRKELHGQCHKAVPVDGAQSYWGATSESAQSLGSALGGLQLASAACWAPAEESPWRFIDPPLALPPGPQADRWAGGESAACSEETLRRGCYTRCSVVHPGPGSESERRPTGLLGGKTRIVVCVEVPWRGSVPRLRSHLP